MIEPEEETDNDRFQREWRECHKDIDQEREVLERHFGPDRSDED